MAVRQPGSLAARGYRLLAMLACLLPVAGIASYAATAAELVMFVEVGCSWCQRWDREVGEAYPRSEEGGRAPLRRLHISAARNSGLRLAGAVTVTPTFVLVEGGAEVGRITGYPGADFFWGMLGDLLRRLEPASPASSPRDAGWVTPCGARCLLQPRQGTALVPIPALGDSPLADRVPGRARLTVALAKGDAP